MNPQPRLNIGDRVRHPDNPCLLIVVATTATHAQCCCTQRDGWHTYPLAELARGDGTAESSAFSDTDVGPHL